MNEWINASEQLPQENESVIIMKNDASGGNAVFLDGLFVIEGNKILPEDVIFWKKSNGSNFENEIKKKCLMCGRKRLYG